MSRSEINLASFVFHSTLKCLWRSAVGVLIATFIIITTFFLTGLYLVDGYDLSSWVNTAVDIVASLFAIFGLTIASFFVLGLPVTILPSTVGSIVLSIWLYYDDRRNHLSPKRSRWKGAVIGLAGGLVALFTPYSYFSWPQLWLSYAKNEYQILFWVIMIVVPVTGAVTGMFLAKRLIQELEPKDDYFSIDWKTLQKEQTEPQPDA